MAGKNPAVLMKVLLLLRPAQVQACLKFAREHLDEPGEDRENGVWLEETEMELFGISAACRGIYANPTPNPTIPTVKP